jgi:hypothetical protein
MGTSRLDFSTTIRLATEPGIVGLPARVVDIARASQAALRLRYLTAGRIAGEFREEWTTRKRRSVVTTAVHSGQRALTFLSHPTLV